MDITRDHSPEAAPGTEKLLERSQIVETGAQAALAVLYAEFEPHWVEPTPPTRPIQGAANLIDRTFLEAQHLELAQGQAVQRAQRRVMEALDELSA